MFSAAGTGVSFCNYAPSRCYESTHHGHPTAQAVKGIELVHTSMSACPMYLLPTIVHVQGTAARLPVTSSKRLLLKACHHCAHCQYCFHLRQPPLFRIEPCCHAATSPVLVPLRTPGVRFAMLPWLLPARGSMRWACTTCIDMHRFALTSGLSPPPAHGALLELFIVCAPKSTGVAPEVVTRFHGTRQVRHCDRCGFHCSCYWLHVLTRRSSRQRVGPDGLQWQLW